MTAARREANELVRMARETIAKIQLLHVKRAALPIVQRWADQ